MDPLHFELDLDSLDVLSLVVSSILDLESVIAAAGPLNDHRNDVCRAPPIDSVCVHKHSWGIYLGQRPGHSRKGYSIPGHFWPCVVRLYTMDLLLHFNKMNI